MKNLWFCFWHTVHRLAAGENAKPKGEWMKIFPFHKIHIQFSTQINLNAVERERMEHLKSIFQAQLMRHRVAIILSVCLTLSTQGKEYEGK